MDWRIFLDIVLMLLGGGGIIAFFTLKARMKKENGEARKVELENEKTEMEIVITKYRELDVYYKEVNRKLEGMSVVLTSLFSAVQKSDFFHCNKVECEQREPALGQYKTKLPKRVTSALEQDDFGKVDN